MRSSPQYLKLRYLVFPFWEVMIVMEGTSSTIIISGTNSTCSYTHGSLGPRPKPIPARIASMLGWVWVWDRDYTHRSTRHCICLYSGYGEYFMQETRCNKSMINSVATHKLRLQFARQLTMEDNFTLYFFEVWGRVHYNMHPWINAYFLQ